MFTAKFLLEGEWVTVSLDTKDPEKNVPYLISGSTENFQEWIQYQHGPFGHLMSPERGCINDLFYVVSQSRSIPTLAHVVKGAELPGMLPMPPEGAVW